MTATGNPPGNPPLDAPRPSAASAPAEEARGLIVIDKPRGITSRKALNQVEARLEIGTLGHCGSLDPLATGVLVLVAGKARKIQDLVVQGEKVYDMTITFGATSDTDDAEGVIAPMPDAQLPSREEVLAHLPRFRGPIEQIPPTYSAVKIEGKRMHRASRCMRLPSILTAL